MKKVDIEKFNDLMKHVEDQEKWAYTDWDMRHQWIGSLIRIKNKILSQDHSHEQLDLFWVKLWGLISEFESPITLFKKNIEDALNKDSDYYKQILPENEVEKIYHLNTVIMGEFNTTLLEQTNIVLNAVNTISNLFSIEEKILICDNRTHICHPTANFYRLALRKDGSIAKEYKLLGEKLDREEVQRILMQIHLKHKNQTPGVDASSSAAIDFSRRIDDDLLINSGASLLIICHMIAPPEWSAAVMSQLEQDQIDHLNRLSHKANKF